MNNAAANGINLELNGARMEEARAAVGAGLTVDPSFIIGQRRDNPFSNSPGYLKQIERY